MPRTTPKIDSKKQLTATTAAKASRVKEGGLGGPRTGRASASTKRVQAKRDSKGK